jgi:hypothetical protein
MMNKKFDCVEMKNRIQKELYKQSQGDFKQSYKIILEISQKSELTKLFK